MIIPQPTKGRADTFDYANSTTLSSLASRPADRTRGGRLKLNRGCTHKVMIEEEAHSLLADLREKHSESETESVLSLPPCLPLY